MICPKCGKTMTFTGKIAKSYSGGYYLTKGAHYPFWAEKELFYSEETFPNAKMPKKRVSAFQSCRNRK